MLFELLLHVRIEAAMVTHAIESVKQIRITVLSRMLQKRLCGLDRCNRRIHQPDIISVSQHR